MTTGYSATNYSSWNCSHNGSVLVAKRGDIELYGGGTSKGVTCTGMDIVLDLTGNYSPTAWPLPESWKSRALILPPRVIKMSVQDMKAPWDIDMHFWKVFWGDLVNEAVIKKGVSHRRLRVLTLCMGGHGRTGTITAALLKASGFKVPDGDYVGFIRNRYCNKAVESADQIEYLRTLGIYVPHSGSKSSGPTYSSGPVNSSSPNTGYRPQEKDSDKKGGGAIQGQLPARTVQPGTLYADQVKDRKTDLPMAGGCMAKDGKWYSIPEMKAMSDAEYHNVFGNGLPESLGG